MERLELTKRLALLVFGIILSVTSIIFIVTGSQIPYFYFNYNIQDTRFEFDFSLLIFFFLLGAGLTAIAVALKLSILPKNVIVSYPVSRFIAGLLMVLLGGVSIILFGVSTGTDYKYGDWLVLGGFSLFYPTGFFPLVIGSMLLLFSLFVYMKLKITRTQDKLVFDEMRFPRAMSTEIPIDQIEAIRLSNANPGPRYFWVLVFIIPVYYLYVDGMSFVTNPNTFGAGQLFGIAYIVSASVQLISMLLLIFQSHYIIDVVTKDKLYELPFYPINLTSLTNTSMRFILQLPAESRPDLDTLSERIAPIEQAGDFKRLCCGIFLVMLGIVSRVFYFWAGEMLRFMLFIAGIILITDAIKNDLKFVHDKLDVTAIDEGRSFMFTSKGIAFKTEYFFSNVRQLVECNKNDFEQANAVVQLRKLNSIDHVIITGLMFLIGLQGFPVLALVFPGMGSFVSSRVIVVICVIAALVFAVILAPVNVFKIDLGKMNFQVPVKMRGDQNGFFLWRLILNFGRKYKMAWQHQRMQFLLRFIEVAVAGILGLIVSAILFYS
ncbi:MAG TPA: hypothetical protein VKM55_17030 [Candidatus Lokiarchaeia archaeon]|nr:hypothetical protein [Candidatus Lokiarchaeia archaeon]